MERHPSVESSNGSNGSNGGGSGGNGDSSTNSCCCSGEEGELANSVDSLDALALDADIKSVLRNRKLHSDEKWFQYYKALERFIHKRDPTFKPLQFTFDLRESSDSVTGEPKFNYVIKPKHRKKSPLSRILKLAGPAVVSPVIGFLLGTLLRHA